CRRSFALRQGGGKMRHSIPGAGLEKPSGVECSDRGRLGIRRFVLDGTHRSTGGRHMMTRLRLELLLICTLLSGLMLSAPALAQSYPDHPITMVVPFPAGGLTDVPARVAATMMSAKIGQNMVVENKTGATGTIGAAFAARATPDGYTLFANSLADAQNVHFMTVTYSPVDDFAQI